MAHASVSAEILHIRPDGDDTHHGSCPAEAFATLERAREANCVVRNRTAAGIPVSVATGINVEHNEVRDGGYADITCGHLSTHASPAAGGRIQFTHVHHVMRELGGGAGIYPDEDAAGVTLRENVIAPIAWARGTERAPVRLAAPFSVRAADLFAKPAGSAKPQSYRS